MGLLVLAWPRGMQAAPPAKAEPACQRRHVEVLRVQPTDRSGQPGRFSILLCAVISADRPAGRHKQAAVVGVLAFWRRGALSPLA